MLKRLPDLLSDDEAERFVASADLSEYDLSGFVPARFTPTGEGGVAVKLPMDLLRRIDEEAGRHGGSRDDFIQRAVERALRERAA